ncbi:hypothetical protein SEPCBS119000_005921 [Sporothrix epigloea]|uniref:Uncharacterized protein n=1 Tax=Sporothrix epigloea TaxID=1892477 RepID=A0ABP0E0J9_9PEZI
MEYHNLDLLGPGFTTEPSDYGEDDSGSEANYAATDGFYSRVSFNTFAALMGAGLSHASNYSDSDEFDDDEEVGSEFDDLVVDFADNNSAFLEDDQSDEDTDDGEHQSYHTAPNLTPVHGPLPLPITNQPVRNSSQEARRIAQYQSWRPTTSVAQLPLGLSAANEVSTTDTADNERDAVEFLGETDFSPPSILESRASSAHSSRVPKDGPSTAHRDGGVNPQAGGQTVDERSVPVSTNTFPFPLPAAPTAAAAASSSTNTIPSPRRLRSSSRPIIAAQGNGPEPALRASQTRKRRRSSEAGPSGTTLPPIADLIASVDDRSRNSSSQFVDSQSSSSSSGISNRVRASPPRKRTAQLIYEEMFGFDWDEDSSTQMVNLVNVDRPQAATQEGAEQSGASSQKDGKTTAQSAATESRTLVRLSAQQCVICMDNISNLTATHCGR